MFRGYHGLYGDVDGGSNGRFRFSLIFHKHIHIFSFFDHRAIGGQDGGRLHTA